MRQVIRSWNPRIPHERRHRAERQRPRHDRREQVEPHRARLAHHRAHAWGQHERQENGERHDLHRLAKRRGLDAQGAEFEHERPRDEQHENDDRVDRRDEQQDAPKPCDDTSRSATDSDRHDRTTIPTSPSIDSSISATPGNNSPSGPHFTRTHPQNVSSSRRAQQAGDVGAEAADLPVAAHETEVAVHGGVPVEHRRERQNCDHRRQRRSSPARATCGSGSTNHNVHRPTRIENITSA